MAYDEEELFEPGEREVQYSSETRLKVWGSNDTGHDLTLDEMLFVRSYVIDRNPVAALRRLDFAGPPAKLKAVAARYLANPEVAGAVDELVGRVLKKLDVTAEKVIGQLAAMAFFDPRSIMTFNGTSMEILDSRLWPDEAIAAVAGVKQTKDAGIELKFVDRLTAVKTLGQQLNLLQDPDELQKKAQAEAVAAAALDKMSQVFERAAANAKALEQSAEDNSETLQ